MSQLVVPYCSVPGRHTFSEMPLTYLHNYDDLAFCAWHSGHGGTQKAGKGFLKFLIHE